MPVAILAKNRFLRCGCVKCSQLYFLDIRLLLIMEYGFLLEVKSHK